MWYNPIITALLRSPLHKMLSGSFLVLTYTGRKTRQTHRVPISYVRVEPLLLTISLRRRTWWRNLRGGAPVAVRLQGRDYAATGNVIEDEAGVVKAFGEFLNQVPRDWVKGYGALLDPDRSVNAESVVRAAQGKVMVEIRLAE